MPEKSFESILICCAGLGMGNASRVAALMESMHELSHRQNLKRRFFVASWGAGLRFLEAYAAKSEFNFEIIKLEDYTGKPMLSWPRIYAKNVMTIRKSLTTVNPSLIVLDSDYHFPAYTARTSPLVSIGQAEDVVLRARRHRTAIRTWAQYLMLQLRERFDSYLQRWFSNLVLVPCFEPGAHAEDAKVRRISLIVRKEFLSEETPATAPAGLLLSGSELQKKEFMDFAERAQWPVLNPAAHGAVPSQVNAIDQFDVVFTQGGLSSISECIARGRFVVAFPMHNHPEQILNAMEAEKIGVGMQASVGELDQLPALLKRIEKARAQVPRFRPKCTGAEEAALVLSSI